MPKLSKQKKEELKGVMQEIGYSQKMIGTLLQSVEAETKQDTRLANKRLRHVLWGNLMEEKKKGIKFTKAELQEFLGQDTIPRKFQEFLIDDEASSKENLRISRRDQNRAE